jgi:acyl-CoA reductase-like NAD-dependent aldehyde dehydrogenase
MSLYLNAFQRRGLNKLGDSIIPATADMPSFSQTNYAYHIDRMLKYLPNNDRQGFTLLLTFFYWQPKIIIKLLLKVLDLEKRLPHKIAAPLRLLQLGLKGPIFTLYYAGLPSSNKQPNEIYQKIKWQTQIQMTGETMNTNNSQDAKIVMAKARHAKKEINQLSVKERVNVVSALKELILLRKDEIIERIQRDTQKCMGDALISEIFSTVDYLHFLEKEAVKALQDETVKTPLALLGKKSQIYFESLGVMLIISPWNYPFYQAIVPIMTSFVCGNSTIYKPSEFTPLTGLVESLLEQAGVQPYWVQVCYGDGQMGSELIEARPNKIFFTGSVATGKKIMRLASDHLIPVELELGGKDPAIVFNDVNIKRAIAGLTWGSLTNNGQSCTSVERIYVQDEIYNQFKNAMIDSVNKIKQTVDKNADSDIGFMTTPMQVAILKEQLRDALAKGATLYTGHEWDGESLHVPPMVMDGITLDMKIAKEESFGPFICLYSFETEAEVINFANDSDFGLAASVWSADKNRALRVARALECGNVSINNVMLTEGNPYLPFGGRKQSGIGSYKGIYGLKSFSQMKSIIIDGNSSKIEANWYPYTPKKYGLFTNLTLGLFGGGIKNFVKFVFSGLKLEAYSAKAKR